jgi:hypothetical protein
MREGDGPDEARIMAEKQSIGRDSQGRRRQQKVRTVF